MKKIFVPFIFTALINASAQDILPQAQDLAEVAEVLAISQGEILEELPLKEKRDCQDGATPKAGEKKDLARLEESSVKVAFEIKHLSGLDGKNSKKFIDYNREGFERKWDTLIQANDEASRKAVMGDICREMSQEEAVAFAGYMGAKNARIYDMRRVSDSGTGNDAYLEEIITLDDYYQVHRNNEGFGDDNGRKEMGVCGDAAVMVADFLSSCKFSCDEIDIVSYRTDSGGHQMVTARGSDGELYTANWSEASSAANPNLLQYQTPDPNLLMTSPTVMLFDCAGRPKGKTTTPLGSILMLAHEDSHTLNFGQEYNELAMVIEKLGGVDKVKLKHFKARANNGQNVAGFAANIEHKFGNENTLLQLETKGSILLAFADRTIQVLPEQSNELKQIILSGYTSNRVTLNALRNKDFTVGLFAEGDATQFYSKHTVEPGEGQEQAEVDLMTRVGAGLKLSTGTENIRVSSEAGIRGVLERNTSQMSGNVIDGEYVSRRYGVVTNHLFAKAQIALNSESGATNTVDVGYQNAVLVRQSRVDASIGRKFQDSGISTGISIIKNPGQETINMLSMGMSKRINVRGNYVELNGGVDYLIVENMPSEGMFRVSVAYRF